MSENVITGYKATLTLVGKSVVVTSFHDQRYEGVLVHVSHKEIAVQRRGCTATFGVDAVSRLEAA